MGDKSTVRISYLGDAASLTRASRKAQEDLDKVGASSKSLSTKAKLGMAGAGAAVLGFAKSASDKFNEVGKESIKLQRYLGGTITEASRLRFAAEESGVGVDDLAKGLGKFSKTIDAARDKTKTMTSHVQVATGAWRKQTTIVKDAHGHFKKLEQMVPVTKMQSFSRVVKITNPIVDKLGFAVRDAHGQLLPMSELLPKVADKFKEMPNGPAKTALALQLFGRSGMSLMPFLNKGAEGIKELTKESDKFGNTLSAKDTDAIKKNIIAKREWHAAITGLQINLGRNLLPALTKVADALSRATQFATAHSAVLKPLTAVVAGLAVATYSVNKAVSIGKSVQSAAMAVQKLFTGSTEAATVATAEQGAAAEGAAVANAANARAMMLGRTAALGFAAAAIYAASKWAAAMNASMDAQEKADDKGGADQQFAQAANRANRDKRTYAAYWTAGWQKKLVAAEKTHDANKVWGVVHAFERSLPKSAASHSTAGGVPMAEGGIVKKRPGGMLATIGEGRHDEAVIPLKRGMNLGGSTRPIVVQLVMPNGRVLHEVLLDHKQLLGRDLDLG